MAGKCGKKEMLKEIRELYRPFEYPEFEDFHRKLMSGFWHPYEIQLGDDINDYKNKLTEDEREIINRILKNFVQSELHIGNFWGDRIADWFKKPEIQDVARYIAGQETIHAKAYDLLNSTLGLEDYDKLKEDVALYARIEMFINKRARTNENILGQIFLYSVMGEGVSLFSSFLTIFAFAKNNLMKGTGQIVSWSALDEQAHSLIGINIFNIFKKEYKLDTPEMYDILYGLAKDVVQVEHNLIDRVFDGLKTDIIHPEAIKNYVNDKTNKQLELVNMDPIFDVNENLLKETAFFNTIINGASAHDFFFSKETNYSKGLIVFNDEVWKK